MKRSSSLSRNFFRRPAIRDLVPDLKLVLVVLTVGCESHAGVYRPAGLGEDTGLDQSALDGAMVDLDRRGHILRDTGTGEVFLRAWYRDNTFKGTARWGQWLEDFKQIESSRLRRVVLEAIAATPECGINPQDVDNSKENQKNQQPTSQGKGEVKSISFSCNSSAAKKTPPSILHGVTCWTPRDLSQVQTLVEEHSAAAVEQAAAELKTAGGEALPSYVQSLLSKRNQHHEEHKQHHPENQHQPEPDAQLLATARSALGFDEPPPPSYLNGEFRRA